MMASLRNPLAPGLAPLRVVPKLDRSVQLHNDFQHLNKVLDFDEYPMPFVDELIDLLGRAQFISSLDLTKGYWQVTLAP